MPHKTYMGIDKRRDHSIRIPRPDHTVEYGTPNACNKCHKDKDAKWAADAVVQFKGPERPKDVRHPAAFHAFRKDKPEAESLLLEVCQDQDSPAFTRAGAMLALRRFMSEASFDEARRNLDANDSVVRVAAISKLEDLPDVDSHRDLIPMLKDPVRSVRTEAARILARSPETLFSGEDLVLFNEVFAELKLRYTSNLDRPESHLSLGILAENRNQPFVAEKHYQQAVRRESTYVPARMNLATLLSQRGRSGEAEKLLIEAAELQPSWGQVHYSLGLLLAEDPNRLPEAIRSLERASAYWKDNPRVFNNLAIAYWQSDKIEDAINSFLQAIRIQPENPEFLQNVVQLLVQRDRWSDALPYARIMVQLLPDNPQAQAFLSQIENNARAK
jgi:tetratricopeptide (TPR) repeat protein